MSTTFPLLMISLLLIIGVFPLTRASFCTYYRSSNRVTCGSVTCSTAEAGASKLPPGNYLVGKSYSRGDTPWFNFLHRQRRSGDGYWDYHTKVPELGCRGGFGLHSGSHSEGGVTVTDSSCFSRLRSQIESNYRLVDFNAYECRSCLWGECRSGISTVRRARTADLQSI